MTTDDLETIALRPTVIGGARQDDDFEVIWRGFPVGRIMKQMDSPHWWWACTVYGLPPTDSIIPFSQPGIGTIPLGFLTLIVVSLLTPKPVAIEPERKPAA